MEMRKIDELIEDETFRRLLPALQNESKEWLNESIKTVGLLEAIVVCKIEGEGEFVGDGLERIDICKSQGITEVPVNILPFKNKAAAAKWRIKKNKHRKQMNPYNEIVAALELCSGELAAEAKQNEIAGGKGVVVEKRKWVDVEIAAIAGTNPDYVSKVKNILKHPQANAQLIAELRNGTRSIRNIPNSNSKPKPQKNGTNSAEQIQVSYDSEKMIWDEWQEENSPEIIEQTATEPDLDYSDYFNKVQAVIQNLCKSFDIVGMTGFVLRMNEQFYRLGFYKGRLKASGETDFKEYFENRDKNIREHFANWVQSEIKKSIPSENTAERSKITGTDASI